MVKVLLAAVAADEVGAVVADGQLRDQNQHFLTVTEDLFAESEHIGKFFSGSFCLLSMGLGVTVKGILDQFERCGAIGGLFF